MTLTPKYAVPAWLGSIAVVAAMVLLFSGLAQYRFDSGASAIAPTIFILPLLGLGCAAAAFGGLLGDRMGRALLLWAVVYMSVSGVGAILSPDPGAAAIMLRQRLLAVAFFLAVRALCSTSDACRWGIRAIIAVQVLSVVLNVYEWFFPLSFSAAYGRAAGLYVNPNIAGEALTCGMIMGSVSLFGLSRGLFLGGSALGVLLTLSRGAAIAGGVAMLWLLKGKGARRRWMLIGATAVVAIIWAAVDMNWVTSDLTDTQPDLFGRMTIEGSRDLNTESRFELAEAGVQMFLANPITGEGLGAMERKNGAGTHNMFVMHLAEHGVLGLFIYPGFLALLIVRGWSMRPHHEFIALAVFFTIWGFFSHNVLDEFEPLAVAALALAPIDALRGAADARAKIPMFSRATFISRTSAIDAR